MRVISEQTFGVLAVLLAISLSCLWGYVVVAYRMYQVQVRGVFRGITILWCVVEYFAIQCLIYVARKKMDWSLGNQKSLQIFFEKLPVIIIVGVTVLQSIVLAGLLSWLYVKRRNRITQMSVKESMDTMPIGICYYLDTGLIRLINHSMQQISLEITGSCMDNGVVFRRLLTEQAENIPTEKSGRDCIVALKDGRMIQFQFSSFQMEQNKLYEMIAFDITELYQLNLELEQENIRQKEINARLKNINEDIKYITIQKEELDAKIRIHDNLGQIGLMAKQYLLQGDSLSQRKNLITAWKENLQVLEHYATTKHLDMYARLQETAKDVGVNLKVKGSLPQEERAREVLLSAIHECLTNTIRHGKADELQVVISWQGKQMQVVFTNNGIVPGKEIRETGGLKLLRQKVEQAGGKMNIQSTPEFQLIVQLNTEMGE